MSHAFLSYRPKSWTLRITVLAAALVVMGLTSVFLTPQAVHAGGVGTAPPGSGGANGYASWNGWGWVSYPTSGSGPSAMRKGNWGYVQTTCWDANFAIMFVVLNKSRWAYVIADSQFEAQNFQHHIESGMTNDPGGGGAFIPSAVAQAAFNSLPLYGVSQQGLTFGQPPLAWFCWGFKPKGYQLSATSTADHTTAKPGDTINWTHVLSNNGPSSTTQNTHSNVSMSGFSNGWPAAGVEYSPGDTPAGAGIGVMRTISGQNSYTVSQADVGNTLCEWMQYDPTNASGGRDGRAAHACVYIPYNYTLTPNTNVDLSGTVETSSVVGVTPTIANAGPTRSQSVQWQVTQILVRPGGTVPNAGGGTSASANVPCGTYFKSLPQATCSTIASGNSVIDLSGAVVSGSPLLTSSVVVGDYPIGTKLCFATSVQPYSSATTDWRHSAPICLIVGTKPKVQVIGGDLMANSVNTSTTRKSFNGAQYTFGSWIEYGIFAVGNIYGAASGSAYAGSGLANANSCNESQLSFVNSTSLGACSSTTVIGHYTNSTSIPDIGSSFSTTGAPTIGSNDLGSSSNSGVYTATGAVTLNGGNIQQGRWVVINAPTADITITGNITYTNGTLHTLVDIPQVVIIANNIHINSNVTNIDAWLIAKNSLDTCADVAGNLSSKLCNNQLIVNGPVAAAKLYLRRTAGSGTGQANSGNPAEIFNLRPDAYMWASLRASGSGSRIQTVYTTELPPRL